MNEPIVLLIDDEPEIRTSYTQAIDLAGFQVRSFANAESALDLVGYAFNGVVVSDIRLPKMDGMTLLGLIHGIDPDIPVVLVTGHADLPLAVNAMREGAYDFLEKPASAQNLSNVVSRAIGHRRLVLENRRLREVAGNRHGIEVRLPGRSGRIEDVRSQISTVAANRTDVFVTGETGTGKEIVARAIHDFSDRSQRPFVIVDCTSLPVEQFDSELFGHEAGAFAGALRPRYGKFEHARGGTILLDEVSSLSREHQAKLLRVIEDRTIIRLGSHEPIALDVRFIATSKVPLEEEVAAGRFRSDLFYRLNTVTINLPTLAERREDIPVIFMHLVEAAAARHGRNEVKVTQSALSDLARRDWPGNIRELRNAAERYVLGLGQESKPRHGHEAMKLGDRMNEFERSIIASALDSANGSLKAVYEQLGISRKTLYEKMQKHGLDKRDFADEANASDNEEDG